MTEVRYNGSVSATVRLLSRNVYSADCRSRPEEVQYGDKISCAYDDFDHMIGVTHDDANPKITCEYDAKATTGTGVHVVWYGLFTRRAV